MQVVAKTFFSSSSLGTVAKTGVASNVRQQH